MKKNNFKSIDFFLNDKNYSQNYTIDFNDYNVDNFRNDLENISDKDLDNKAKIKFLKLFHQAAEKVPAYKKFLKENKIDHQNIVTWHDWQKIPLIDKSNYLNKYSLEDLCWQESFHKQSMISVSSGSSGDPFFWFRSSWQEFEASLQHEMLFKEFFQIDNKTTLLIVCFSMGMYVAGVLTQNCGMRLSQKNYPLTVISPGINIEEISSLINKLGNKYDQIILAGYPPFLKDIIDVGLKNNIRWDEFNLKFLFAGEGFSEKWRLEIMEKSGCKNKIYDSFSLYGSADANILAHETPVTIYLRQLALADKKIKDILFFQMVNIPGLFQYNPLSKYFEQVDNELVFSSDGSIPLLRYNIKDEGKVIPFEEMRKKLGENGINILNKNSKNSISVWNLPFLELVGKKSAIILYGLLIYPDNIKKGLEDDRIKKYVSGRFTLEKIYDNNKNYYLEINIELMENIKISNKDKNTIQKIVIESLRATNFEFNKLFESMGEKVLPKIEFWDYNNSNYFSRLGKQSWIIN